MSVSINDKGQDQLLLRKIRSQSTRTCTVAASLSALILKFFNLEVILCC